MSQIIFTSSATLKTFINGTIRRKASEETKQTTGKNALNLGDATALNLIWNRYFFGLILKKVQITHIPTLSKCAKELFINIGLTDHKRVVQKSLKRSHQKKHADQYLQRNISKQVRKGTFTQKMSKFKKGHQKSSPK